MACCGVGVDTDTKLDIKSFRMILLLGFIIIAIVGCSSSDDIVPREPSIAQAYIHFCLSDDFDCDYPLPLRVLTTGSDISLGGTVFAGLFNGVVTGTGGCFDPDGYPLWAPPQTTITWSNTTTGEQGYGRTYWSLVVYGVCQSFWEVDNIPLTWGDNKLVFNGVGDDGRSAGIQATVTRRPGRPQSFEYEALEDEHTFKWTEDLPGAASFNLYYSTTPNFTSDFPIYENDDNLIHVSDINSPYVLTGLEENVIYYFAIAGVTDNGVIGVLSDELSQMTYKPRVLDTLPAVSATGVELDTKITVTFNKEVSDSSVNSSTFTLFDNNGATVPATVDVVGNTATLTPAALLSSDKMYSVAISDVVEDLYNNSLGSVYSWNFTTVDILAPSIQSYKPGALEIDAFQNSIIEVTFDGPIDCSTVNANSISLSPFTTGIVTCNSAVINFTPSILLDPNTVYVVKINAGIKDLAGNPTLADFSWFFTSGQAVAWARTFQSGSSVMGNVIETADNGYLMAGFRNSGNSYSYWSMKTDYVGNREWERSANDFRASSLVQDFDGGFVVAGTTYKYFDKFYSEVDALIMKLDVDGFPIWQKQYNDTVGATTRLYSVVPVSTGGYIAVGWWRYGFTQYEAWVLRIDDSGDVLWQKSYNPRSGAADILETSDGGYVFTGSVIESIGNSSDLWVVKLDSDGVILWQKSFGRTDLDESGAAIEKTSDGGYIVAGNTSPYGLGRSDFWILKLNSLGVVEWQYRYGGGGEDFAAAIRQTADDGYIVAGQTDSFGAGSNDVWLLKLDMNGISQWQRTYGNTGNDVARSIERTTDGGYIIGGESDDDWWAFKIDGDGDIRFNTPSGYQLNDTNAFLAPNAYVPNVAVGSGVSASSIVNTMMMPFVTVNSITEQQAP